MVPAEGLIEEKEGEEEVRPTHYLLRLLPKMLVEKGHRLSYPSWHHILFTDTIYRRNCWTSENPSPCPCHATHHLFCCAPSVALPPPLTLPPTCPAAPLLSRYPLLSCCPPPAPVLSCPHAPLLHCSPPVPLPPSCPSVPCLSHCPFLWRKTT